METQETVVGTRSESYSLTVFERSEKMGGEEFEKSGEITILLISFNLLFIPLLAPLARDSAD
jgi:hypothetical protein